MTIFAKTRKFLQKEDVMKKLIFLCGIVFSMSYGHAGDSIQVLCQSPRVYLLPDFLTPEQCDHIIAEASDKLCTFYSFR